MPPEDDAEQRELAQRIRNGDVPPGTPARVKREVAERLRIASPRYLETYGEAAPE
jgi:DNA-binding FadR family transcriptional regulator